MFGYTRTTAVQVFNGITELETNPLPYTLVVVMLGLALIMYLLSRLARLRAEPLPQSRDTPPRPPFPARGFRKILAPLAFLAVTLAARFPSYRADSDCGFPQLVWDGSAGASDFSAFRQCAVA